MILVEEIQPETIQGDYLQLESRLMESFRYIPLEKKHYEVYSSFYADLLLSIGSTLDSCFSHAAHSQVYDNDENFLKLRKLSKPEIKDYKAVYEPFYQMSKREVHFLLDYEISCENWDEPYSKYAVLKPYHLWHCPDSMETRPGKWWTAYNKIKHNRYEYIKRANLQNVLDALAGLFLFLFVHIGYRKIWLVLDYVYPKGHLDLWKDLLCKEPILRSTKIRDVVYVKTKLFGSFYELEEGFYGKSKTPPGVYLSPYPHFRSL